MTRQGKPKAELELRRRAEKLLATRSARHAPARRDLLRLVHELEVHQIELEMQNEELSGSRLAVEEALRRHTELFDFAPIGYAVVTRDAVIRAVNLSGARMLGVDRQLLVGRRFTAYVDIRHLASFRAFFERVLARGGEHAPRESCELALSGMGRESFEARLAAAVVGSGEARAVMIAIEDITAQRCAEAALRAQSQRKDEFMAALSHELRNPLSPIRSSLFVLERVAPGSEQARSALAIIDRQIDHLTHIVDDLLDVTRIAHGKIRLQRERLALADIVAHTVNDHRLAFDANEVGLSGRFDSDPLWVDADATRLIQVAGNLLANALKYTPPGGHVEVVVRREGEAAALHVRDTGAGIAPEVREHVFETFAQGPQPLDRASGGLGLGLAMVKGLVELHGGTVEVVSAGLGHGAEFTVRLPLAARADEQARPAGEPSNSSERVLVIEDNVDAGESLRDLLAAQGHHVQLALDGPTGLALARDSRPDIVICDIGLPEMDGYEVARAIRADAALDHTYLVALSGYAQPEDRLRASEAGFDRHIAKPPTLQQLRRLRETQRPDARVAHR